jgi:hypothetical protein
MSKKHFPVSLLDSLITSRFRNMEINAPNIGTSSVEWSMSYRHVSESDDDSSDSIVFGDRYTTNAVCQQSDDSDVVNEILYTLNDVKSCFRKYFLNIIYHHLLIRQKKLKIMTMQL